MEQREPKEKITFVFPKYVLDTMRTLAKDHQRSLIGEIVWALRQYIKQHQNQETYGDHPRLQDGIEAE